MSLTRKQVIEYIKNLKADELQEFIEELQEVFGIPLANPTPSVAMGASLTPPIISNPPFYDWDRKVVLLECGFSKIEVIKVVRERLSLGLKAAKDLVESAPVTLCEGVSPDEAKGLVDALRQCGAQVEIR